MLGQTPPRGNSDIIVPGEGGPDLGGQSLQGCKLEERRHPGGGGGEKSFCLYLHLLNTAIGPTVTFQTDHI